MCVGNFIIAIISFSMLYASFWCQTVQFHFNNETKEPEAWANLPCFQYLKSRSFGTALDFLKIVFLSIFKSRTKQNLWSVQYSCCLSCRYFFKFYIRDLRFQKGDTDCVKLSIYSHLRLSQIFQNLCSKTGGGSVTIYLHLFVVS